MEKNFLITKLTSLNLENELSEIGFDKQYINVAKNKYQSDLYKIFGLTPVQATILKQTALSCGTDCALHHDVLTHSIDFSDVILFATDAQLKEIIKKLHLQPFGLKKLACNLENIKQNTLSPIKIKNNILNFEKTYIMGILNYTPNSFSDGGEHFEQKSALQHYEEIIKQGADIIDIGAESTAPQNEPISQEEENKRLKQIFSDCRNFNPQIPISIDTRNALTAKEMLMLGADIINDISGLTNDKNMAKIVADFDAYIVLTFNDVIKENTMSETIKGLTKRINLAKEAGIKEDKIIIDPGLGFNKTYEQNLELIKKAFQITSIGFPTLYGLSRKSFVQKMSNQEIKKTTPADIALSSYLVQQGVNIIRVHDVFAHKIAFTALDKVIYD